MQPDFKQFNELLSKGIFVPVSQEIPADLETPVTVFMKLEKLGASFLLESVESGKNLGRYSVIGLGPSFTFKVENDTAIINRNGQESKILLADKDPFNILKELLSEYKVATIEDNVAGLFSGAVGYIGYDMIRYFEKVPCTKPKELNLPGSLFYFTDTMLIFDHVKRTLSITVLVQSKEEVGDEDAAKTLYDEAQKKIEEIRKILSQPLSNDILRHSKEGQLGDGQQKKSNFTLEEFKQAVVKAKDYIKAGDIFHYPIQMLDQDRLLSGIDILLDKVDRSLHLSRHIDYPPANIFDLTGELSFKLFPRHI